MKEYLEKKPYVIYTDSSFDDFTQIGTYAIIVVQENKVLKGQTP